jgi:hypothetical protein
VQDGERLVVECVVALARGTDRGQVDVADGGVRGAVLPPLRAEDPDGADAVVPENGRHARVRDDALGAAGELHVDAAGIGEAPARLGSGRGGPLAGTAGGKAQQRAEGGGTGEEAAPAEAGGGHGDHGNLRERALVCLR